MAINAGHFEVPAKISPRLSGGTVHSLRVTNMGLEIGTWAGVFGNPDSQVIITVPRTALRSADYLAPRWNRAGRCVVGYVDGRGQASQLTVAVVDSELSGVNPWTQTLGQVLKEMLAGHDLAPTMAVHIEFGQIRPTSKLIFGFTFLGLLDLRLRTVPISRYADPSLPSGWLDTTLVVLVTDVVREGGLRD